MTVFIAPFLSVRCLMFFGDVGNRFVYFIFYFYCHTFGDTSGYFGDMGWGCYSSSYSYYADAWFARSTGSLLLLISREWVLSNVALLFTQPNSHLV